MTHREAPTYHTGVRPRDRALGVLLDDPPHPATWWPLF